jgi:simple sugar transport system substrate-binding protein
VIVVDRQVSVEDDSLYRSWVGSDFYQEGKTAVGWMEKEFAAVESLRILHLQGTEGATAQLLRSRALEEAVGRHRTWSVEAALKGEFTEAKGYEVVRDFLKTGTDFDVLYSENDNMTFGAMRALDEAGISYGRDGKVKIISFDAVRKALEYCQEGRINLCVECNPLHGPRVDRLIRSLETGDSIQKFSYVEETFFTCDAITQQMIDEREY